MIDHGHHWPQIQQYTRRQMTLFYRYALRRESHARADRIEDISSGFNGGKKTAQRVRKLRNH